MRDEAVGRPLIDLLRRADLDDAALVEHRHPVGHGERLALVVRDEDEGEAERALQILQLALHLLAQLEVERAERLVEQQHLGPHHQRAGERDALALAAGELRRAAPLHAGELDHGERLAGQRLALGPPDAAHAQPIGDVLADREMREQRIVLEHGVHRPPIRRQALAPSRRRSRYGRHRAARSRRSAAGTWSCRSRRGRAWRRTRRAGWTGRRRRPLSPFRNAASRPGSGRRGWSGRCRAWRA